MSDVARLYLSGQLLDIGYGAMAADSEREREAREWVDTLVWHGVRVMVPPQTASKTRPVVDVYEDTYVRRAD